MTAIEYGLIAAAIAVVILGAVNQVGKDLVELFGDISSALTDRTTGGAGGEGVK
ncbi:Flp family type IVb pilin [Vibrio owensii]|nr:Flp family type IVb pilin [Vibrio owensii]